MKFKLSALSIAIPVMLSANMTEVNAAEKPQQERVGSVKVETVGGPVTPRIVNIDLRSAPKAKQWQPGDPVKEVPRRTYRAADEKGPVSRKYSEDPLAAKQTDYDEFAYRAFGSTIINIEGQGFSGVNPPDPVIDVGQDYVVQAINTSGNIGTLLNIYNKADGTLEAGPIALQTLGGTGDCATGAGDPIVLYDEDAGRWFIQEFTGNGPNDLCIYISQTGDPVSGGWYFYEFQDNAFPDYPHFGVWSDAYYGTANKNASVYAFDRVNMLAGNTARPVQTFDLSGLPGYNFQTPTPADWDKLLGTSAPPAGAPGIIMRHVDEEAHNTFTDRPNEDILEMYEFVVDFDDVNNSSVNLTSSIDITDFNSWLVNYTTFYSVPQPAGGTLLDPIREVILNRLQYVNFGTHESIIGVFPTNLNPATSGTSVTAGLRWFELRRTGGTSGTWALHQEGTYADLNTPTENRFVGALSMDSAGNIAMAYSLTDVDGSNQVFPSLKYTGRLAGDTLGVMTQTEADIVLGSASNSSGRWGDYAAMAVDPVDGCTFWFTGEYSPASSWGTRLASFKFDACGDPGYALSADNTTQEVCVLNGPANFSSTVDVVSVAGFTDNVDLSFNPALPAGITGTIATTPVAPGNSTTVDYTIADTVAAGNYGLTLEGNSAGAAFPMQVVNYSVDVVDALPGAVNLTSPADDAIDINTSGVTFEWDALPGVSGYLFELSDTSDFSNILESVSVGTNAYTTGLSLDPATEHFWRVTPENICGASTDPMAEFSFTTANKICFIPVPSTPIPDGQPTNPNGPPGLIDFTLTANSTELVDSMMVELNIAHTWIGDLKVTLSKDGTDVVLMDRPGTPPGDYGCGSDNVDATFDDASTTAVEGVCSVTPPGIGGVVKPEQALSAFNGVALGGDWNINVADNANLDTGDFVSLCLIPTTMPNNDLIFENGFE